MLSNTLLLANSKPWSSFLLKDIPSSPQSYVIWVIVFLIVLFMLSRLRNILEERSTKRAMTIARAFVGSLIAFLIAPIIFFLLLNIIAMVHGVETIHIGFLVKWIGLTISSYWWLLRCAFGSESLSGATVMYSVDSIIRMLWIILPFSFIWIRMSKTKIAKFFLIPMIIAVFVVTRYKIAPSTFITEDKELVQRIPFLKMFTVDADAPYQDNSLSLGQRKLFAGILLFLLIVGFVIGLHLQRYLIGFIVAAIGLLGFILMAPHKQEKVIPESHHEDYHVDLDSMIHLMGDLHQRNPDTIALYHLTLKIQSAYHARIDMGDNIIFPDSLCDKYDSYFYDWCKE